MARSHPIWFRDTIDQLKPLLDDRNDAYLRWLKTNKAEDHIRFKNARGIARREKEERKTSGSKIERKKQKENDLEERYYKNASETCNVEKRTTTIKNH